MNRAALCDPKDLYSWSVSGYTDRWAGGVACDRDHAVEQLAAALRADVGTEGEVQICHLAPKIGYEYGDVIACAEVDQNGAVVWSDVAARGRGRAGGSGAGLTGLPGVAAPGRT